jgi:hypothetical protein
MLHVRVNVPPIPGAIEALAEGLVRLNCFYMEHADERGIETPSLYACGIVYRREPHGEEWWESAADALGVATHRSGDCEDLAAYRAAELRTFLDEPTACVRIVRTKRGSFHAIVQRGDGSIEDPSRICVALEARRKAGR